jgi:translation initiation factor 4A
MTSKSLPAEKYEIYATSSEGQPTNPGGPSELPTAGFRQDEEEDVTFESGLGVTLGENLLRGIYGHGFESPSTVQAKAIGPVASGVDTIIQAQSGSGKTGAFSIGLLQRIECGCGELQAIVLAPTRELARQTHGVLEALSEYMSIKVALCVGGSSILADIADMRRAPPQVVVGTAGRLLDMLQKRRALDPRRLKCLCIDEADEMFSFGFMDQVHNLFQIIPPACQVSLFSATMAPEVLELTEKFMRDPIRVLVKDEALTLEGISQYYVAVDKEEWKLDSLCDLYEALSLAQTIIFVSARRKSEWLANAMEQRDFTTSLLHGEVEANDRQNVMREFKSGSSRVLIATDLISRGIDVQTVSLVVNFDLPTDVASYLHRIGRSGRFGRKGVAISLLTDKDVSGLRAIERHYETIVEELPNDVEALLE